VDQPSTPPLGTVADRRDDGPAKVACAACEHPRDAHEHHRRGTDCSQSGCGCLQWKKPRGKLAGLLHR
jgi:hypothetical protein